MKRSVGALFNLLTFSATACSSSGSNRSWSEFEACINATYVPDPDFPRDSDEIPWQVLVEDYRNREYRLGSYGGRTDRPVRECEKVMPIVVAPPRS